MLDETMSMALPNINKINSKLRFLYQKNILLTLIQLLCNALVQPQFD